MSIRRTLADHEQLLGDTHPRTLIYRGELAVAYREAGRLGEAIPLFERTLADSEQLLGDTDPDTLTHRGNLAQAYQVRAKAEELRERAEPDS